MKDRSEVLAEAAADGLRPWVSRIEGMGSIENVHPKALGLVMMSAEESVRRTVFHVGEILISDATVTLDGTIGYGITMGGDQEKAWMLAVIDAFFRSADPKWTALRGEMETWLESEREAQRAGRRALFELVARTKVDFELMDTEREDEA